MSVRLLVGKVEICRRMTCGGGRVKFQIWVWSSTGNEGKRWNCEAMVGVCGVGWGRVEE